MSRFFLGLSWCALLGAPVFVRAQEPAPVESPTVEPAPVEPSPVEASPVEPAPVDASPAEPAPLEPAPVQPVQAPVAEPKPAPELVQPKAPVVTAEPVVPPAPEPGTAPTAAPLAEPLPEPPAALTKLEAEREPIEVIVLGTRISETPGSVHSVGEKELERWEYDDPHAVLTTVPGVYVRQEDAMGLRPNIGVRGVNPDRSKKLTLMEDGVLFGPAPYSAPAAYYFPLLTRMTEVRVIKGPAAISYGPQTVGGAIDLITRKIPTATEASADIAVGQYGYGKAHLYAGTSTEQFGFLVEGVRLQNNGFKELDGGGDTGFARNEWMAKFSYIVDPRARVENELTLKLTYSDETSNESYLGLTEADFDRNPNRRYAVSQLDRMHNHRFSVVAGHELDTGKHVKLSTQLYRHSYDRTWRKVNGFRGASIFEVLRDPNAPSNQYYHDILVGETESASAADAILIGPNQREFVSEGIQTKLTLEGDTGPIAHRVEAGARYHHDFIERRHSENGFLVSGTELIPDGAPTVVTAFNRGESHAVALHALDAMSFRSLTLTPGVRVELIRFLSDDRLVNNESKRFEYAVLPGVGAYYAIASGLGVLAGVHRGFSPPPPDAAKSAEPEESLNYEAGARYTQKSLRVEAIGFYNDYDNLTDICTGSGGCTNDMIDQQFDAGKARIYGAEAFGSYDLKLGKFTLPLLVSYTFTEGEFLRQFDSSDPIFQGAKKGDAMPYLPQHQARGSIGLEHLRAGGELAVNYVSAMREEPGQGAIESGLATEKLVVLDLSARVNIIRHLSLYMNVQNLLDSQSVVSHRPFGARPNAPRWIHVGLKASL